jgi:hypothetical protein
MMQVNGRKRHIAVDALGLLLGVVITSAAILDGDAAKNLHRSTGEWISTIANYLSRRWLRASVVIKSVGP